MENGDIGLAQVTEQGIESLTQMILYPVIFPLAWYFLIKFFVLALDIFLSQK